MMFHAAKTLMIMTASSALLWGCSQGGGHSHDGDHTHGADHSHETDFADYANLFDAKTVIGTPKQVECTLSGGAVTTCLSITVQPAPQSYEIGPWCPQNISDGPDLSGIWLEGRKVYDADGAFIQNMSSFYKDEQWKMFDPETAARPDVDPQYQNHCVECQIDYMPAGSSQTYVIPLTPINVDRLPDRIGRGGVGISLSGARLDGPAPVDAILSAHTLAPFDDCGGHINTNVGYHIHAVTDTNCMNAVSVADGHAKQIGLALDGYPIHWRFDDNQTEPSDLDQCRGHEDETLGYHYHVNDPGANAILGCHRAQTGCSLSSPDAVCNASQSERRGPPAGDRPDRSARE